jgi:hypothetical protein
VRNLATSATLTMGLHAIRSGAGPNFAGYHKRIRRGRKERCGRCGRRLISILPLRHPAKVLKYDDLSLTVPGSQFLVLSFPVPRKNRFHGRHTLPPWPIRFSFSNIFEHRECDVDDGGHWRNVTKEWDEQVKSFAWLVRTDREHRDTQGRCGVVRASCDGRRPCHGITSRATPPPFDPPA